MKFLKFGLILSCFALFIFACSQAANTNNTANITVNSVNKTPNTNAPATATPADELASGKSVFMEKCVKCHKESGTGGEVDVLGKKHTAADFTSEKLKKDSDEEYIGVIQNGETEEGMPSFKGKLTDEQIKAVVKFIRKEFQGK